MTRKPRAFTAVDLQAALTAAGLLPVQTFSHDCPESLAWLQAQAARTGAPTLLSLFAEEVPDLVPSTLSRAQVLYFALPTSMKQCIGKLLQAEWDCYGELTDTPWRHAVYLALCHRAAIAGLLQDEVAPLLSFRSDALDLSRAFAKGYAILMFDCEGTLYSRGIVVGEELGVDISACENSTFQRPLRVHSLRRLQERTRAVEETGIDPEGPPNGGHPLVPVLCSPLARGKPFDIAQLPQRKKRHLPIVMWNSVPDAVIGWLPEVTHFREECAGESPLVIKVSVMPEMYKRIQDGNYRAKVQLVPAGELSYRGAYVLMVESERDVAVVNMPVRDMRFRAVYGYWTRFRKCQVAFENFHNGRLHLRHVAWPEARVNDLSAGQEGADESEQDCWASSALVNALVRARGTCLTCYTCGVTDQEGWRAADDGE